MTGFEAMSRTIRDNRRLERGRFLQKTRLRVCFTQNSDSEVPGFSRDARDAREEEKIAQRERVSWGDVKGLTFSGSVWRQRQLASSAWRRSLCPVFAWLVSELILVIYLP